MSFVNETRLHEMTVEPIIIDRSSQADTIFCDEDPAVDLLSLDVHRSLLT